MALRGPRAIRRYSRDASSTRWCQVRDTVLGSSTWLLGRSCAKRTTSLVEKERRLETRKKKKKKKKKKKPANGKKKRKFLQRRWYPATMAATLICWKGKRCKTTPGTYPCLRTSPRHFPPLLWFMRAMRVATGHYTGFRLRDPSDSRRMARDRLQRDYKGSSTRRFVPSIGDYSLSLSLSLSFPRNPFEMLHIPTSSDS